MFRHLSEDWPWIVVPILVVAFGATCWVLLTGSEPEAMFVYPM